MRASRSARITFTALEVLLILVASSALLHYYVSRHTTQREIQAASARKFNSLYDAGKASMDKRDYPAALDSFRQAEQSAGLLTDDQYASLKSSREQIARTCHSAGLSSQAQSAYSDLVNSGLHQGKLLMDHGHCKDALMRFQDARQSSDELAEDREKYMVQSGEGMMSALRNLSRYSEAIDVAQRALDYIRANSDAYDPNLTAEYQQMALTYSQERDWPEAERNLTSAWSECDNRIAHFSATAGAEQSLSDALSDEVHTLRQLIDVYQSDGKTDSALATAESLFTLVDQHSAPGGHVASFSRMDAVNLALKIATGVKRQDAITAWRQRQRQLWSSQSRSHWPN